MRHWMVLASLCALNLSACVLHLGEDEDSDELILGNGRGPADAPAEPTEVCLIAATDGGNGGLGGLLSIRTLTPVVIDGLLLTDGGRAGEPGLSAELAAAMPGSPGEAGVIEVIEETGFDFDEAQVEPEDVILVGTNAGDEVIAVGGTEANPTIKVSRMEIGPGATLALSRYPTIMAQTLIVHEGGRLLLRDAGRALVSVGDGSEADTPGLSGGSVTILAQELVIDGIIEASGSDGAPGEDGGHGGHLLIRAEHVSVSSTGAVLVTGGDGGHGLDEQLCSEAP